MKTAEEIWDENHKHESTVGWSNLAGGYVNKKTRSDKERGIAAMHAFAKQAVEQCAERAKVHPNKTHENGYPMVDTESILTVLEDLK